jgi:hypothetical protein
VIRNYSSNPHTCHFAHVYIHILLPVVAANFCMFASFNQLLLSSLFGLVSIFSHIFQRVHCSASDVTCDWSELAASLCPCVADFGVIREVLSDGSLSYGNKSAPLHCSFFVLFHSTMYHHFFGISDL